MIILRFIFRCTIIILLIIISRIFDDVANTFALRPNKHREYYGMGMKINEGQFERF